MAHIESKFTIKAPVERVFDYLATPATRPEWLDSTIKVENISEGPIGVGTSWTEVAKIAGRVIEQVRTVTEYERPSRYVMEFAVFGAKTGRFDITFEPEDSSTQVTMIFDYTLPASALGQIADKLLVERRIKKTFGHDIGTLRMILEQEHTTDK
jgi:uncharacterized protein YndB with AHSA1/START domain